MRPHPHLPFPGSALVLCLPLLLQTLARMYVINAGSVFRTLWSGIRGMLDPKTASKIHVSLIGSQGILPSPVEQGTTVDRRWCQQADGEEEQPQPHMCLVLQVLGPKYHEKLFEAIDPR